SREGAGVVADRDAGRGLHRQVEGRDRPADRRGGGGTDRRRPRVEQRTPRKKPPAHAEVELLEVVSAGALRPVAEVELHLHGPLARRELSDARLEGGEAALLHRAIAG